ncbi:MAG: hypothetical protein HQM16_17705 [Deltaproteobacteria bacterium]|nr:hypothetical protein [Deltaproteobacteria bacterium]
MKYLRVVLLLFLMMFVCEASQGGSWSKKSTGQKDVTDESTEENKLTHLQKKQARETLKKVYFIKDSDLGEFKEAYERNDLKVVELFLQSNGKDIMNVGFFRYGGGKDFLEYVVEHEQWAMLKMIAKYISLESYEVGRILKRFLYKTSSDIQKLTTDCELQEKVLKSLYYQSEEIITFCKGFWENYTPTFYKYEIHTMFTALLSALQMCYGDRDCIMDHQHFWDQKNQDYIQGVIALVKARNDEMCQKGRLDNCRLSKIYEDEYIPLFAKKKSEHFERLAQEMQNKIKSGANMRFLNSPQSIVSQWCNAMEMLTTSQNILENERRISESAGVVNQQRLYQAGQLQVWAKDSIKELVYKYKKKTGKDLNSEQCPP